MGSSKQSKQSKESESRRSRRDADRGASTAERVTLAVSILLFVVLVGGLLWIELSRGHEPPRIVVEPDFAQAEQREDAWYLPVVVRNEGDLATDVLRVDIVRPIDGEQPEVAELEWAFVAGGEEVEGIAVFDEEPTAETIEVDVVAATDP